MTSKPRKLLGNGQERNKTLLYTSAVTRKFYLFSQNTDVETFRSLGFFTFQAGGCEGGGGQR